MIELQEQSAFGEALPIQQGGVTLAAADIGPIWSIMPFSGRQKDVSAVLKESYGFVLPAPGRSTRKGSVSCQWMGRGQAFLIGAQPESSLAGLAAVTEQTDAWASAELSGAGAEDVLARLIPVDVSARTFKRGHCARTLCGHVPISILRSGAQSFQIMAFRSMAQVLAHDLGEAMALVAARSRED